MAGRAFVSRFSPNRTDPAVLEAIFVQRHKLAEIWLERLRDSVLTGVKHHLLAVGPRGCGKSHLVALLVGRLRKDPVVVERVRIAWLPEDETTPSFWKFLLRILRALNTEYGDEFPPLPRDQLADATDARRSTVLIDYLLKKLDGRALLVVVENLDDLMRGLKDEGQKRWRAFLQEHPVATTLASAQQLTKDVSNRDRPFFNFFQIEHLRPLSADEALLLLQKIAGHSNNTPLVAFLQTPTGRARVRAIRHIAGGSHRVFIILSEFATRENLDDLVTAFEELLDELTPYYQERLRWLPDQQREIVEFLCRQARTVPVKEIAAELFLTEQTAAAQLKSLKDKGYLTAGTVGRESRYELAEPLMRLCVEVKDPQREPIRLIVEFLRIWYDGAGLEARLQCLPADADLERQYYQAVIQAHRPEIPSPVVSALNRDLEAARAVGDPEEVVRVLVDLAATTDDVWRCLAVARETTPSPGTTRGMR
jgi:DNA-binding Lrp family transcriptional regulator